MTLWKRFFLHCSHEWATIFLSIFTVIIVSIICHCSSIFTLIKIYSISTKIFATTTWSTFQKCLTCYNRQSVQHISEYTTLVGALVVHEEWYCDGDMLHLALICRIVYFNSILLKCLYFKKEGLKLFRLWYIRQVINP